METTEGQFTAIENLPNVWKQCVTKGTPEIQDNQPENTPWKGKPRSILFEFLFKLSGEGDTVENMDKEDPEEYSVPREGQENSNERYFK
jgi:hypothetical protein